MKKKAYYRIFSAGLPKAFFSPKTSSFLRGIWLYLQLVFVVHLLFVAIIFSMYALFLQQENMKQYKERVDLRSKLYYWERVVNTHPNFPDAYYNASYYSFRLGEKEKAISYIDKALFYDPNFVKAEQLRNELLY